MTKKRTMRPGWKASGKYGSTRRLLHVDGSESGWVLVALACGKGCWVAYIDTGLNRIMALDHSGPFSARQCEDEATTQALAEATSLYVSGLTGSVAKAPESKP